MSQLSSLNLQHGVTNLSIRQRQVTPVNFPNFRKLPTEVRYMIWELAASVPRKIQLRSSFSWHQPDRVPRIPGLDNQVPPLLMVCHEAKKVALILYTKFRERQFVPTLPARLQRLEEESPPLFSIPSESSSRDGEEETPDQDKGSLKRYTRTVHLNFSDDIFLHRGLDVVDNPGFWIPAYTFFSNFGDNVVAQIQHLEFHLKCGRHDAFYPHHSIIRSLNLADLTVVMEEPASTIENNVSSCDSHQSRLEFESKYSKEFNSLRSKEDRAQIAVNFRWIIPIRGLPGPTEAMD